MDAWRRLWCRWPWTRGQWGRCRAQGETEERPPSTEQLKTILGASWPGDAAWSSLEQSTRARWERQPYPGATLLDAEGSPLWQASSYGYVTVVGAPTLPGRRVGIVGTRRLDVTACERWQHWLRDLLAELESIVVVSGGAFGVDRVAQDAALAAGHPVEVRLAGGLFHAGPRAHQNAFLEVVSAGGHLSWNAPPPTPTPRGAFLRRNTWLVETVDVLVVVRAPAQSGAMHTAREARRLGVPVLAVPGDPQDPLAAGPLALLSEGARVLGCAQDLREAMAGSRGPSLPVRQMQTRGSSANTSAPARTPVEEPAPLTGDAARVASLLKAGALDESALLRRGGLEPTRLASLLLELELEGRLHRQPGGRWALA